LKILLASMFFHKVVRNITIFTKQTTKKHFNI